MGTTSEPSVVSTTGGSVGPTPGHRGAPGTLVHLMMSGTTQVASSGGGTTSTSSIARTEGDWLRKGDHIIIRDRPTEHADEVEREVEVIGWDHGVIEVRAV